MSEVQEIETRVRKLSGKALAQFREWFHAYENDVWDQQIASDYKTGKFDKLIARARKEFEQGKAKEL